MKKMINLAVWINPRARTDEKPPAATLNSIVQLPQNC